ncbi:MAG: hypothetical protein AB1758_21400, partial [Candidatus Eremiobacterota bacterium]
MMRRRGASLQLVMALVLIMSVLAVTMVAIYMSNLNFTQSTLNGNLAQLEAESAITEVIGKLTANPDFGVSGQSLRGTSTPKTDPREAWHEVTFDSGSSLPYSTNTVGGTRTGYGGRSLPAGAVHVVATGFFRGQYRSIEAVIEHPPFPFGIASDGPILSTTPLIVQGTSGIVGETVMEPTLDRPGHVASNSSLATAVDLNGAATRVTGFVQSCGGIRVDPAAVIKGGMRPYYAALDLPLLDFNAFNIQNDAIQVLDREFFEKQNLNTLYYASDDVVFNGGINFQKGLLRCARSVTVREGIKGEGAIVCDGDVNILGGLTSLAGSNRVAIVAKGNVNLLGNEQRFQGLLYTEGTLQADNVMIVGNVVVNPENPGNTPTVTLKDTRVVADQSASTLRFNVPRPGSVQFQTEPGRMPFKP